MEAFIINQLKEQQMRREERPRMYLELYDDSGYTGVNNEEQRENDRGIMFIPLHEEQ